MNPDGMSSSEASLAASAESDESSCSAAAPFFESADEASIAVNRVLVPSVDVSVGNNGASAFIRW